MSPLHANILNLFFVLFGLLFFFTEKILPARAIEYTKELKIDLISFGLLLVSGAMVSTPLIHAYYHLNLGVFNYLQELNPVAKILGATVVNDFINYWIHYQMHRSNFYWKVHVHHHRIENLYWFSGLRASFTHYLSFILSRITVGVFLFRLSSLELLIYLIIGLGFNSFQHTNTRMKSKFLEKIFVFPRMHRYHHSSKGRRMVNLGSIFSFWDRLFNTFQPQDKTPDHYELGIKAEDSRFS